MLIFRTFSGIFFPALSSKCVLMLDQNLQDEFFKHNGCKKFRHTIMCQPYS